MNIDKNLKEILTSTLVIENKKGIPFAVAKIKELIVSNNDKPTVSGSLCCQCGLRKKVIGDKCISCSHGWTDKQHNYR